MGLKITLKKRIEAGEQLVIAELIPPRDATPDSIRAQAAALKGKVHAVGLADNRDGVGMSAIAAAALISQEGIEPIVHMVTRDRNRIALESDFLGARALGVSNILCTTGTHQTLGTFKSAKNVFDVDSVQLLRLFSSHAAFNGATCLGATASPFAEPVELQIMRLVKKVAVGAAFVITQPIFDLELFSKWWDEVKRRGLHEKTAFIAGIRPLLRRNTAAAYANGRPNPRIPTALLARIAGAADDDTARREGIAQAVATIQKLKSTVGIRGFEICAGDDIDAASEIIRRAGLGMS
jgi:methylenetetrahydrofolate reductase (NADPH)